MCFDTGEGPGSGVKCCSRYGNAKQTVSCRQTGWLRLCRAHHVDIITGASSQIIFDRSPWPIYHSDSAGKKHAERRSNETALRQRFEQRDSLPSLLEENLECIGPSVISKPCRNLHQIHLNWLLSTGDGALEGLETR